MGDLITLKPLSIAKDSPLYQKMLEETKKMAGGGDNRRISIRGGRFRNMVGGEQVGKPKSTPLNVIVVRASGINRTYFHGAYDPENPIPPRCWSTDGTAPAPEVPKDKRMSNACASCKMNIKGSGQGTSRACRYSVRLAILLEGDLEHVYQLQIPAASLFGKRAGSNMGFQAYNKYLSEQGVGVGMVVTQLSFDEDSETPKLFFSPVRSVEQEEWDAVEALHDSPEVLDAVTLTVYQTDEPKEIAIEDPDDDEDEEEAPAPRKRAKPEPVAEDDDEDEDEDEDEEEAPAPRKRAKAKTSKPAVEKSSIANTLAAWGD